MEFVLVMRAKVARTPGSGSKSGNVVEIAPPAPLAEASSHPAFGTAAASGIKSSARLVGSALS